MKTISNTFRCETCADHPEFTDASAALVHLREFHKVPKGAPGTKRLTMHLNRGKFHDSVYELEIGGVKFTNMTTVQMRG